MKLITKLKDPTNSKILVDKANDEHIVSSTLPEQRFSHDYLVGRKEAKEVTKPDTVDVSDETDDTAQEPYNEHYELCSWDLHTTKKMSWVATLAEATFHGGIIESVGLSYPHTTVKQVRRIEEDVPSGPITRYSELIREERWVKNDEV